MVIRVLLVTLLLLPAPLRADGPVVFAAASLRGVLERAVEGLSPAPRLSYGGSGAIAQQMARGAPADLVILASPDWMGWLAERGHVTGAHTLWGGRLVVVARAGPPLKAANTDALRARLNGGRLAIGQRRAVPAGIYARAWLEHIGAWDTLEPHLAEAQDVRAALAFVVQSAAPLGVVYASDALAEPRVQVIYEVPQDAHPPIRYPIAALTDRGAAVLAHLRGQAPLFEAAGFEVLP
ncbi:MAG: molybdate ABC transporter substrate-binding protein [Pseudomonadota bacterium]